MGSLRLRWSPAVAAGSGAPAPVGLAEAGFAVVVAGRRPEPLEEVVAEIAGHGRRALAVPTDVADPDAVAALFERVADASAGSTCCSTTPGSGRRRSPSRSCRWSAGSGSSTST